jgi:hypothetical protein
MRCFDPTLHGGGHLGVSDLEDAGGGAGDDGERVGVRGRSRTSRKWA